MKALSFLSSGALCLVLALAACQETGPIAVQPDDESRHRLTVVDGVQFIPSPPTRGLRLAGQTSTVIGPEGGSIQLDGALLTVPPGALAGPVTFTLASKPERYQYKFGPNGLQFAVPATLSIQVDPAQVGVDPARLAVATASDAVDDWQILGGAYDPVAGTVSVAIHHFTQYALCQN